MQHENGPARSVRYRTLTEYKREVSASAIVLRPVSASSDYQLPFQKPSLPSDILFLPKRLQKSTHINKYNVVSSSSVRNVTCDGFHRATIAAWS
ncbi:hypothetical protein EVAR_25426_1 [Eumeta japonica]|uniref:Uncharacterized protein n=1 Tax=Eumeta variegata TaxID=151549 RepID=A0A4C1V7V7_EUMVA|nr:hypothetical protein EVAR_25426_1 [Eumeta japonica]